jgi:hypothetical protein
MRRLICARAAGPRRLEGSPGGLKAIWQIKSEALAFRKTDPGMQASLLVRDLT